MPKQVRAFGQILYFPDEMSDDDMAKAILDNEHVLNPDFKRSSGVSGLVGGIARGAKQTGRSVGAAVDTMRGNLRGVEEHADASELAVQRDMPEEQHKLVNDLVNIDREQGVLDQIGGTLKAAKNNPMGTAQFVVEQAPNTVVSLGSGYAGFKAGAAAGALAGPMGAAVGGTLGFLGGMFLGNVLLETGSKAIEKASDEDGFTPSDRDETLVEGPVKAGVITGVDAFTLKAGSVITKMLGKGAVKEGAKAEAKVLIDAGVDMSSPATINAALKISPELFKTARIAGERAALQSMSRTKKSGILGTGMALETVGEGVGEYAGEFAATGEPDVVDATMESLAGATQSAIETAYNFNKLKSGNDLSPQGIQKAADSLNKERTQQGIHKINKAQSVDEAINAANEMVYQKPATKDSVLTTIDPSLKDLERLTGLKPSEAVESAFNQSQQGLTEESLSTQAASKNILSGVNLEGQFSQPQGASNEEINAKQKIQQATSQDAKLLGNDTEIVLPDNTSLPIQWSVVDADTIKASIKEGINQPRDRSRAASDIQIQSIANNPDYRRLSDSPIMDVGAPVIDSTGAIVGGNGRFEALARAHEQGTAANYLSNLKADAANKGIDPAVIDSIRKPILVRRITKPFDTRKLAIASNSGTSLQYSALELAKIDAERMKDIGDLDVADTGDIPLTSNNINRIKLSLNGYNATEQASFVDAQGNLSQEGLKRIKNAVLYNAYGNSPTLSRLVESTDSDIRNVTGVLMKVAGHVANFKSEVSRGAIPKELDITDDLIGSVEKFSQLRAQNQTVEQYLAQQQVFDDDISQESKDIMQVLANNIRSQKKLTEFVRALYDEISRIDMSSNDVFGDLQLPSKREFINNAKQRTEPQQITGKQAGIFERSRSEPDEKSRQEPKTDAGNEERDAEGGNGLRVEQPQSALNFGKLNLDYGQIEQRPGTSQKQRDTGTSAYRGIVKRVVDREQGNLLGLAIASDFRKQGATSLIGREVKSSWDLALLAQVLRDPRFETFRFFFTKADKIVHHYSVTARLPGSVPLYAKLPGESESQAQKRYLESIREQMRNSGADGYYLLHNHPSGNSDASAADKNVTKLIASAIPGFKSHVIIDTNEWSRVDSDGFSEKIIDDFTGRSYSKDAAIPHDILHTKIKDARDFAVIGKQLQNKDGFFVLLGMSVGLKVNAIAEFPVSITAKSEAYQHGILRTFARNSGSGSAVVIANPKDVPKFVKAVVNGILLDVVDIETGEGSRFAGQTKLFGNGDAKINLSADENQESFNKKKLSKADIQPLADKYNKRLTYGEVVVLDDESELPGNAMPLKQVAWHGSPHDHDKFSTDKIGTGEGAAAFGYGLYFTDNQEIAEFYRNQLSISVKKLSDIASQYSQLSDAEAVKKLIIAARSAEFNNRKSEAAEYRETANWITNGRPEKFGGKLYQVDLKPQEDEYLLWDTPLSEQSDKVKEALRNSGKEDILAQYGMDSTGENIYRRASNPMLQKKLGIKPPSFKSDKLASEYLHSLGIRGIKYLDGSSRNAGEGSYNYVIFSDDDVEIQAKFSKDLGAIEGAYVGNSKAYIVANGISDLDRAARVINHELSHLATEELLNRKEYRQAIQSVQLLEKAGNKAIKELALDVDQRQPGLDPDTRAKEILAMSVETGKYKQVSSLKRIVADLVRAFKRMLHKLGMNFKMVESMSDGEVFSVMRRAMDMLYNGSQRNNGSSRRNALNSKSKNQEIPETINIDGVDRPTRNSNGHLIHPTEEGIRNFWEWFGDSKVLDGQGNPLILYHGTNQNFTEFELKNIQADGGFWFAEDANFAHVFGDNIISSYIRSNNPLRLSEATEAYTIEEWSSILNEQGINDVKFDSALSDELRYAFSELLQNKGNVLDGDSNLIERIRNSGFNSIHGPDEQSSSSMGKQRTGSVWVAFAPNQIKSVTSNHGSFDGSKNNFLLSRSKPAEIPEIINIDGVNRPTRNSEGKLIHPDLEGIKNFWRWFENSKVVDDQGRPLVVFHGTKDDFTEFNKSAEGIHFGTVKQAAMRASGRGKYLMPVYIRLENEQRSKDLSGKWSSKIKAAKSSGKDGIVYLNRYEGIDYSTIERAQSQGFSIDSASDVVLRRFAPELEDSYIVFNPNQIKSAIGNNGSFSKKDNNILLSRSNTNQKSAIPQNQPLTEPDNETVNTAQPASKTKGAELPQETRFRKAQRLTQDAFNRFTVIKEWLAERGINLSEQADAYAAEERYHSKVANQIEDFREKVRNPLIEKIAKAGFTMSDISDYLEAQHASEANAAIQKLQNNPDATAYGITDEEAKAYLDKAPKELGVLANEIRDITEQTKKLRLDNGLLNKDITDAWEATYKHYIPVKGDAEANKGSGKGLKVNFKTKRRLGHGKRDEAVIENILMDHERAIMEVEKNRVGKHVVMMAAEIGMPELMTIDQPEKRKVLKNTTAFEVQVKGITRAVFDSIEAARTFKQMLPAADKKITASDISINPTNDQRVVASASPMLAENEINVYMDGHAIRVQIKDELLARAYGKLGIEGYGKLVAAGRMLNGYLSKVYTGYNPEFIITNIVRDFSAGTINLTGEEGILMAAKTVKNYPGTFASLLKYAATNGKSSNEWIDSYRANGGNTGAAYLSDMERLGNEVASEYASYQGVIANIKQGDIANASRAAGRKVFNATLKWIYNLNQAGENAMRLAAFKAMLESGRTPNEAAHIAKNITVNFNRKGELGNEANAAYLFFNASVQGVAATSHALTKGKHKGQAWALATSMATLGYLAAAALAGGDEEDYDKVDDFTKERNVLIKSRDGYVKIPVPYGYGFFWNLGRSMADAQRKDELGTLPWHIASSAIEELTPFGDIVVGSDEGFNSDQVLLGLLPTALKIPFQPAMNKQIFSGGELMPESQFDQSQPDREKMWRGTKGTMYDHVSGWLEDAGMDVSPETLKHYTRTFTGGAGALVDSSVSAAMLKKEGAELEPNEMPFIRKAYTELTIREHRAAYHKAKEEAQKAAEEFDRARKRNDLVSMQKVMEDKREMIALDAYANSLSKVVKIARDEQDAVRLSDKFTVAEKRLRLKELEARESKLYDNFLDVFKIQSLDMKERNKKELQ